MADDQLKEEPILARLRGKPGEAPAGLTSLVGLLGRSPKPGHWLLYPNLDMSRSVESQNPTLSTRKSSRPSTRRSAVWAAHAYSSSVTPKSPIPSHRRKKRMLQRRMNSTSMFGPAR